MHRLLAAILATPDDLDLHAVYADELQRAGDPRGELIAIELALAVEPARSDLVARRIALRAEHAAAWWPGIPPQHVRTRHGFVEAIAIRADQIETAVALARTEPLRSLELLGPVSPQTLARVPAIATLVAHELTDEGLRALYAAPCAATLATLDLSGSEILAFAPRDALPACRHLSLAATWATAHGLAEWTHARGLRELDMSLPRGRYLWFDLAKVFHAMPDLEVLRASCTEDLSTHATREALARLRLVTLEAHRSDVTGFAEALPATNVITAVPERIALDLVGETLVFTAAGEVERHGERLPLHIRFTQADAIEYGTQILYDDARVARLLIDALACSAPRLLTPTGCTLAAALLPADNRVTATIEVHDTRIDLELEHYID